MNHPRRKFVQKGIVGVWTALFSSLPKISFAKHSSNPDKGIVVRGDEGIHILTGRRKVPITIKISKKRRASIIFPFVLKR
jgi:hypothetical protein